MRIRDKIKKPQRPVVTYEILPPREKDGTLNTYAETISSLLSQTHIDAINIPEVHDEIGRGERPVSNQDRGEPRKFGLAFWGLFSRVPSDFRAAQGLSGPEAGALHLAESSRRRR